MPRILRLITGSIPGKRRASIKLTCEFGGAPEFGPQRQRTASALLITWAWTSSTRRPPFPRTSVDLFDRVTHNSGSRPDLVGSAVIPAACSIAAATAKTVSSSIRLPDHLQPQRQPVHIQTRWHRHPRHPAMLDGICECVVRKYILMRDLVHISPCAKAADGAVGEPVTRPPAQTPR